MKRQSREEATRRRFLANLDAMVGRRYADLDEHRLYIANAGIHNRLIRIVDGAIKRTGGGHESDSND